MAQKNQDENDLKHELANAEQQKRALQHLLERASDEIDGLVESECGEEDKAKAAEASKRFRRASTL